MENEGGRIFKSGNRTRQDQNRGRIDKGSIGLANSSRSQEYTKVLKTS